MGEDRHNLLNMAFSNQLEPGKIYTVGAPLYNAPHPRQKGLLSRVKWIWRNYIRGIKNTEIVEIVIKDPTPTKTSGGV